MIEPGHRILGDPAGAITAAREPDGVEAGIVGAFEQRGEARCIRSGEVAVGLEALRVEVERDAGKFGRGQRGHARRVLTGHGRRGGADRDAGHGPV